MRWESVVRIGVVTLLAITAISSTGTQARSTLENEAILAWKDGPPRYLMTGKEYDEVRKITSIPDLSHFITMFWLRRDPTPGTLENEFRREYWARVLEANRLYRDSTLPGWKTDRGKVFILLGPPDSVVLDQSPGFITKPASGGDDGLDSFDRNPTDVVRGLERWAYTRRNALATDSEFFVAFIRDESLDWKLSTNAELIQPNFPGSVTTDPSDPSFGGIESFVLARNNVDLPQPSVEQQLASLFPPVDTSLFVNYDLGLEMAVASNPELMLATVTAREFLSSFPASPRFEFFRAQDGTTFVSVGALVKASDLYPEGSAGSSSLRLYASAIAVGKSSATRYVANETSPAAVVIAQGPPPGGAYDTWTGLALAPGRYRFTLAIEDSLTGRIGRTDAEADVPDLSRPGVSLSTLVLASNVSDAGSRLDVTARPTGIFHRSEMLGVYYEVYGLPGGDAAVFQTSYRFYREKADGSLTALGKPLALEDRTGEAQGWSVPLAKWPAGRYRMEVTVTGHDGAAATSQVPFEIVE